MAKKTIKMLRDDKGSEDGHTVLRFEDGKTYEVDEALADALVKSKEDGGRGSAEFTKEKASEKAKTVNNEDAPPPPKKSNKD